MTSISLEDWEALGLNPNVHEGFHKPTLWSSMTLEPYEGVSSQIRYGIWYATDNLGSFLGFFPTREEAERVLVTLRMLRS